MNIHIHIPKNNDIPGNPKLCYTIPFAPKPPEPEEVQAVRDAVVAMAKNAGDRLYLQNRKPKKGGRKI